MTFPSLGTSGLITYADFERATPNHLTREDEPGLSITGDLTTGAWVYFDFQSTGRVTGIINKWYDVGNQRSYALYKTAGGALTFSVSNNGSTVYSASDMGVNYRES
jgi:urocanate hydratase